MRSVAAMSTDCMFSYPRGAVHLCVATMAMERVLCEFRMEDALSDSLVTQEWREEGAC